MKPLRYFLAVMLGALPLWAQSATINKASGWLESAFVEWQPVSGATSYNVYYTGGGLANQKLDNPLVRNYGSYYRADALGLAAGSYTLKIVPVISGVEGTATTTSALTVLAHDRSGFAFANSRVPGAYKADGTPKSGAVILYVTENTKNTVSLTVTGASANPCVGLQTILDAFKKGSDTRPLIIRMVGNISDLSYMWDGDIVIENSKNAASYITLEGVGQDAVANGWGIRIKNASNIEVRNIGIMNVNSGEGDNIGLQQNDDYVWVHHNDFFYGDAGSDADQVKGDGSLDCKKSTYVTFSYNHFWDNGKSNLLGLSEGTTTGLYISYHHNWYDHSDSRHPRVRYYSAHVYNNYYDGVAKYGIGSTLGSSVFVEGNYFRNTKYPMLTSMQGTDIYNGEPTFSEENGGTIKAYDNYMEGQKRFVAYGAAAYTNSSVQFDAYVVSSRSTTVPSTVKSVAGSNVYNNFDTDASVMYSYTADSPANAKTKVTTYAGRVSGGDFKWTFNNAADDSASALNTALKAALVAYKTSLVAVQGEGSSTVSSSSTASSSSVVASSSSSVVSSSSSTTSSSSSVVASSSSVVSSSSTVVSSSSATVAAPVFTKRGTGSSSQTVTQGVSIVGFYFSWTNATNVSVTGVPAGISAVVSTTAQTVTFSGAPTAAAGAYTYTLTTVGGSSVVTKKGTFTVVAASSSSSTTVSSSSIASSSSATVSSSSVASSSSATVSSSSVASSSSATVSSSSATSSSSGTVGTLKTCIAFVNGVGSYGSNCYSSGLAGMASGACYTMNPARGTSPTWINSNATDTWWWSIASCSGIQAKFTLAAAAQSTPASYQVYDMLGHLHSSSALEPQNLPRGQWILVTRNADGKALSRKLLQQR